MDYKKMWEELRESAIEIIRWAEYELSMWQREADHNMRVDEREYAMGCVASLNQFIGKLKQMTKLETDNQRRPR